MTIDELRTELVKAMARDWLSGLCYLHKTQLNEQAHRETAELYGLTKWEDKASRMHELDKGLCPYSSALEQALAEKRGATAERDRINKERNKARQQEALKEKNAKEAERQAKEQELLDLVYSKTLYRPPTKPTRKNQPRATKHNKEGRKVLRKVSKQDKKHALMILETMWSAVEKECRRRAKPKAVKKAREAVRAEVLRTLSEGFKVETLGNRIKESVEKHSKPLRSLQAQGIKQALTPDKVVILKSLIVDRCAECGGKFHPNRNSQGKSNHMYCSVQCRNKANRKQKQL